MARTYDATAFTVENGGTDSNELVVPLRDADQIMVFAPAGAEADYRFQIYSGAGWFDYDATAFTAGAYRTFEARGLRYRIHKVAGTAGAQRVFEVVKRVGA
jgi:hypothetical protein